jgi:CNT family concentrative nucleoside transporter
MLGLISFATLGWLISENRRHVSIRLILSGIGLQLLLGFLLLKAPPLERFFLLINKAVLLLESATTAGTSFVFGYLGGGPLPFTETYAGAAFILAFRALPLVVVISALAALLFYWRILPLVVNAFAWVLKKSMRLGGAEGLAISANIFVGMVEAPLLVRPYLKQMSRSEIFTLMTCGMATIAGTVMVLYASILSSVVDGVLGHILTASIISAPAAVTVAKTMIPETQSPTEGRMVPLGDAINALDAVTKGALDGMRLLINIVAMLIALVALVHLVNLILALVPPVAGGAVTLQRILGLIMAPVVWLMGVPWSECLQAGALMGTKTVLNELLAYLDLSRLPDAALSERSRLIMIYALCGFANPGSVGIMIGGLGSMVDERRDEIVALGFRSLVAGTIATSMTGAVVGIISAL